ncbi:MAG: methylated-DNA--[protein]-cysteine S-methyltransferase [Candidatus Caldatribacterium sp.]|nr:methylated-DNA--[protein]-cysteine S-methyltransferase [Candidatus Caldatribacterium sp.]
MKLAICFVPTRFGLSILAWREKIEFFILPQRTKEKALMHLHRWISTDELQEDTPPFPGIVEEIQAYFEGKRVAFSHPLALDHLPPFTRKVLEAVAQIPYGSTLTYGDIAQKIALPHATRAVGRALGRNPLPLFIPCHRVTGKMNLGGFSGYGLRYKILLLSLELSGNGLCGNRTL